MAQKTISVKVSTKKVIDALEKALHKRKTQIADYEKAVKEHNQAEKEFRDSLAELFRSGKGKVTSVSKSYNYRNEDSNKYELSIEFPASVKAPKEPKQEFREWEIKQEIEELENAIAVLKMTDEETISTSTYKGVARFIK
jgi:chromosome segregation ATPase